ncbi:MAG: PilZ domain-containing protein [Candidatus Omnitrophota bacterium]|nr:PilZ domain-containing protein [Candidatus Omnitrophota bacterium]
MKKIFLEIRYSSGKDAKAYILDISLGGMGIACSKKINRKTMVEILPKKNVLCSLRGKVVSVLNMPRKSYKYRLGVKFLFLKTGELKKITGFINKIVKRKVARLTFI